MTSAENFRVSTILIRRVSELGLITDTNLEGGSRLILILEPVKDGSRYPRRICQYETAEECLSFLEGCNSLGIGAL